MTPGSLERWEQSGLATSLAGRGVGVGGREEGQAGEHRVPGTAEFTPRAAHSVLSPGHRVPGGPVKPSRLRRGCAPPGLQLVFGSTGCSLSQ